MQQRQQYQQQQQQQYQPQQSQNNFNNTGINVNNYIQRPQTSPQQIRTVNLQNTISQNPQNRPQSSQYSGIKAQQLNSLHNQFFSNNKTVNNVSPMPTTQIFDEKNKEEIKSNLVKKINSKMNEMKLVKTVPNYETFVNKFLVQEKLKKLVEKKTVALVGPAKYLINSGQGDALDKYDVVIRFNGSIISNQNFENHVGSRTDVWIYNFKDIALLDNLSNKLPKMIFCPYPKKIVDGYNINKQLPECEIEFIEELFFEQLKSSLNIEPNSALLTILVLLRQNIKSLYVTGISFLYDGYYDNIEKNTKHQSGALILNGDQRNNYVSILKKLFNANDKLMLDHTIIRLIYPNFVTVLNHLFIKPNFGKFYSTLNYILFVPSFQNRYNAVNTNSKIYVHFGSSPIESDLPDKMNLIIHGTKPKSFSNEVYVMSNICDYDDLDTLLNTKNKGVIYFANNQWNAVNTMIPNKNRDYILTHHCYVNGNIYGSFIKYIVKDFDITIDSKNLNMLYVLFTAIYFGQKMIYVSSKNVIDNGLREIINVMKKLNLIKYVE